MIFTANLLTAAKHPAFSTNHLTDTDKQNRTTTKNNKTQTTMQDGWMDGWRRFYGALSMQILAMLCG